MRFLSSGSGITKTVIAILIVLFTSTVAGISYYAAISLSTQSPLTTPTPSPEPTETVMPTSTFQSMPPQSLTSTSPSTMPNASTNPTPTLTSTSTPIPTPHQTTSANPIPTPSPAELSIQENVRDSAMSFIKLNHPETAQFMTNLAWTGGRVTAQNDVGTETYTYYSQGWNVTISNPVVPNAIYKIVADYSATGISIPYRVIWKGTWQNEVINETSYIFAQ